MSRAKFCQRLVITILVITVFFPNLTIWGLFIDNQYLRVPAGLTKNEIIDSDQGIHTAKKPESNVRYYTKFTKPGASMSAGYGQTILEEFFRQITMKKGKVRILDVGSGLGFNLPTLIGYFKKQGVEIEVVALDLAKQSLQVARLVNSKEEVTMKKDVLVKKYRFSENDIETLKRSRPEEKIDLSIVSFFQGDAQKFFLKNESFDLVVCTEMLEHVEKPLKAMQEINRVIKPNGYLIYSTPNYQGNPVGLVKLIMDWLAGFPYWEPWHSHSEEGNKGRENFMTAYRLEKFAKFYGFSITRTIGLNYWLAWFLPLTILHDIREKTGIDLENRYPGFIINRIFPLSLLKQTSMNYFILAQKEKSTNSKDHLPELKQKSSPKIINRILNISV